MRRWITVLLTVAMVLDIMTMSALSEPAPEYDEYEQSRGESWDERYGEGEVEGDYMGSWTVAFCDEWVSLRARPDKYSERLLKVPKWADVEAYYYDGNWFECIYNGQRGFISRDYLTDRPGKFPDYPGNEDYQNNDVPSEYVESQNYANDYYTGTWETGYYPDENIGLKSDEESDDRRAFDDIDMVDSSNSVHDEQGKIFDYGSERVYTRNLPEWRGNMKVHVIWDNSDLSPDLADYLYSDRWTKFDVDLSYERWDESYLHHGNEVYSDLDDIIYFEIMDGNLSYMIDEIDVMFVFGAEPEKMGQTIELCQMKNIGLYISSTVDPLMAYETICDKTTGL